MKRALVFLALAGLLAGGCGGSAKAKVKGRLVSNGQPMTFPASQAAVSLAPIGADGKPDTAKSFTIAVKEDGTFELVASGGELPTGNYQVAIQAMGKLGQQLKGFASPNSPVRRELKSGANDITIDVAKPDGG
jgi:hypothetical protein